MGANDGAQLSREMPLVRDPASVACITTLGESLARLTERSDLEWHFAIVDSKDVNAFGLAGGYIRRARARAA